MKAERQASSNLVQQTVDEKRQPRQKQGVYRPGDRANTREGWREHCRRAGMRGSARVSYDWLTDWLICVVMDMCRWACVYHPGICVEVRGGTCGNWFYSSIMWVLELTLRCSDLVARPFPAKPPHGSTARFYARKLHKNKKQKNLHLFQKSHSLWLLCVAWLNHFWTS